MKNLNEYSIEELQEAIRLKEAKEIEEFAEKCNGTFILNNDLAFIGDTEFFEDFDFVTKESLDNFLLKEIKHYPKGMTFSLSAEKDECDDYSFKVKFHNGDEYESNVSTDRISTILGNSNFPF